MPPGTTVLWSGEPLFSDLDREAELMVSIYNKQGQVSWNIPDSIRARQASALAK